MSGRSNLRARAAVQIAVVAVVGSAILARYVLSCRAAGTFQDLNVYRTGADAIASGLTPYAVRVRGHGDLVFTYPPFAGVVFVPLTWVPAGVASAVLVLISALCYALVVVIVGRRLRWAAPATAAALLLGLASAPVVRTVQQGQVNLILAAMIAADVWLLPRRWRGTLIGVAAGIKLVPAVFVLYAVARRDWRSATRTAATGLVTVTVAWALAPQASWQYWTGMVLDTSRSGGGGYPDNQSLVGVLARMTDQGHPPLWATIALQGWALFLAYACARRAVRAGRPVEGVLAVAVGGLLASPVSWSHHWIWCVPMVMTLMTMKRHAAALLATFVYVIPPLALSPAGWLNSTPRGLWLLTTALFPTMGLAWLTVAWRHYASAQPRSPAAVVRHSHTASPQPPTPVPLLYPNGTSMLRVLDPSAALSILARAANARPPRSSESCCRTGSWLRQPRALVEARSSRVLCAQSRGELL